MAEQIFIQLDEEHLKALVLGQEARITTTNGATEVRMILADIGWTRILEAIRTAI